MAKLKQEILDRWFCKNLQERKIHRLKILEDFGVKQRRFYDIVKNGINRKKDVEKFKEYLDV